MAVNELVKQCISVEENKGRLSSNIVNFFLWCFVLILVVATYGGILLFWGFSALFRYLLTDYYIKNLQSIGTTASKAQFPEIIKELEAVCLKLGIDEIPKIIIISGSQVNAFAIKFAKKKVIVLPSETLEGVLSNPEELRFFLGHELGHMALDFGARGFFELYKSAAYKSARELTCDNCGLAVSGDLEQSKNSLKRLAVGNKLFDKLKDSYLINESDYIYSGFTGWLLKRYMTYPPLGKRISNLENFKLKNW